MFRFECCGGKRKAKVYVLAKSKFYQQVLLKAGFCSKCKKYVVVLEKTTNDGKINRTIKRGYDAVVLFDRQRFNILFELKPIQAGKSAFYLQYQEYGAIKKCYSNLRTLKLGITPDNFEDIKTNNGVIDLHEFYSKQQRLCKKCS